jgi:hypothetical protein
MNLRAYYQILRLAIDIVVWMGLFRILLVNSVNGILGWGPLTRIDTETPGTDTILVTVFHVSKGSDCAISPVTIYVRFGISRS